MEKLRLGAKIITIITLHLEVGRMPTALGKKQSGWVFGTVVKWPLGMSPVRKACLKSWLCTTWRQQRMAQVLAFLLPQERSKSGCGLLAVA